MPSVLSVVDLTATTGRHALAQLGVSSQDLYGHWPDLALGDTSVPLRIDWRRPGGAVPLAELPADAHALAVLIGPGALRQLPAVLAMAADNRRPAFLFVSPTAIVEASYLRSPQARLGGHVVTFHLPSSDPQALWFALLEQLGKLPSPERPPDGGAQEGAFSVSSNLKQAIESAMTIDGASAVALVDYRNGMCLAQAGSGLNLDLAAAGNTEVVRAKLKTAESLGLRDKIEDILITLSTQYHLIRLVPTHPGLFLYLVLDKAKGNLALARYKLADIERTLKV